MSSFCKVYTIALQVSGTITQMYTWPGRTDEQVL